VTLQPDFYKPGVLTADHFTPAGSRHRLVTGLVFYLVFYSRNYFYYYRGKNASGLLEKVIRATGKSHQRNTAKVIRRHGRIHHGKNHHQ